MTAEFTAVSDAGEADYFSAILAMQQTAEHSRALPFALSEMIDVLQTTLEQEGVEWIWPKPILLNTGELAGYGAKENIRVFQLSSENTEWIIALDQSALTELATLLLGGKPAFSKRNASPIEGQIVQGCLKLMNTGFKHLDSAQSTVVWQDYAGARLAFHESQESPFFVVMINRRADHSIKQHLKVPNSEQQEHLRRALGEGVLRVEYVLAGGQVSLALLRNLAPGSVLPLGNLDDLSLEARANGKTIYNGVLNLSPDHMKFNVKSVLAGANHER